MAKFAAGYDFVIREEDEVMVLPEWWKAKYPSIQIDHQYFALTAEFICLKTGYMWDGATGVPRKVQLTILKSFIIPSGFHDLGIQLIREHGIKIDPNDNHRLFYEACRGAGMWKAVAKPAYFAVKEIGPRLPGSQQFTHRTRSAPSPIITRSIAAELD